MIDVEKKIADYRARKEREARYNKFKQKFTSFFSSEHIKESKEPLLLQSDEAVHDNTNNINDNLSDVDSLNEEDETLNCCTYTQWIYYILWFTLWATIYSIFIQLQFGTVYLIASGLIGICYNTRTGPKKKGEVSAYSVFNKDCKSIDGTLKAEQFEREIRYGPAIVR